MTELETLAAQLASAQQEIEWRDRALEQFKEWGNYSAYDDDYDQDKCPIYEHKSPVAFRWLKGRETNGN